MQATMIKIHRRSQQKDQRRRQPEYTAKEQEKKNIVGDVVKALLASIVVDRELTLSRLSCVVTSDGIASLLKRKKRNADNSNSGQNNEEDNAGPSNVENNAENRQDDDTEEQEEIDEIVESSVLNEPADGYDTEDQREIEKLVGRRFTYAQLAVATENFKYANMLGEGGFGRVYRGRLQDPDQIVAVKRMNPKRRDGKKEFLAEVKVLSSFNHPNLIKLVGFCAEGHQRLLVYEFMPLGSLYDHLHGEHPDKRQLNWNTRLRLAVETARGLAYLHVNAGSPIIYRDLKTPNILLDADLTVKLSDFGMAKKGPTGKETYVMEKDRVGTYGYCPPEYAMTGLLNMKTDIFSFGIVFLELITGRKALDDTKPDVDGSLFYWAKDLLKNKKNFPGMADPALEGQYTQKQLVEALSIAAACISFEADPRPRVSQVLAALESLFGSLNKDPQSSDRAESSGVKDVEQGDEHIGENNKGDAMSGLSRSKTTGALLLLLPERRKHTLLVNNDAEVLLLKFVCMYVLDKSNLGPNNENEETNNADEPVQSTVANGQRMFTFEQLVAATENFKADNLLGEGGFGKVYKGKLQDTHQIVAVKRLDPEGSQGLREFLIEALALSLVDHPNLVKLIGYGGQDVEKLLVYEFMPLGSLDNHLYGEHPNKKLLDWNTSFGVVLLELITGRKAVDATKPEEPDLVSWARPFFKGKENYCDMVDPALEGRFPSEGLDMALVVCKLCLHIKPSWRPIAADVVKALDKLASQNNDPQKASDKAGSSGVKKGDEGEG
ncbi:hypothetical protein QVD17_34290 [Tagetes erecta]|uniref:Protein kinase domain-containing protein n=1 Tax=Tagetes erecta TaxID=13708 RepID=A0AAD8JZH2_TARER|nr:hypothetical protein QVD17_34290 [Tagetes erecta]